MYDILKSSSVTMSEPIDGEVLNFTIKTTIMEDIIQKEDREEIQRTIDKFLSILSPLQKEALYLRYIQELDYPDIASLLNRSEDSIRQLVFQAIHKIRKENKILPMIVFINLLFNTLR